MAAIKAAEAAIPSDPSTMDLMRTAISEAIKAALQEARNPSPTDKEIAQAQRWQDFWKEQTKAAEHQRLVDEARCGHIRRENGKTLMHFSLNQFVPGAAEGHCSRCSFAVSNYDEKGVFPKEDPRYQQFVKWAGPTDSTVW